MQYHSFETRLGPAGRTGWTVNRWVSWFEPTFGSVMQLTRSKPVTRPSCRSDRFFFFLLN